MIILFIGFWILFVLLIVGVCALIQCDIYLPPKEKRERICISFKGKYQTPFIMITKEYYNDMGNLEYAKVLWDF